MKRRTSLSPVTGLTLGLVGLSLLACGGEAPLLHAECGPAARPASVVQPLQAHTGAIPDWTATWGADSIHVGKSAVKLPQIADIPGWISRLPPIPAADGGPLLCAIGLAGGEGMATAAIALPGSPMLRIDDTWPAMSQLAVSLPGAVIPAGGRVQVAAARVRSSCRPDTFLLLTTGIPIPECQDRQTGVIDQAAIWSGELRVEQHGSTLRCRAADFATAAAQAAEALSGFDHTIQALCRQPEWSAMSEQTAQGFIWEAAAWVGWADPAIRAARAQLDRVRAAYP